MVESSDVSIESNGKTLESAAGLIRSGHAHHICESIAWSLNNIIHMVCYKNRNHIIENDIYSYDTTRDNELYDCIIKIAKYVRQHPRYEMSALEWSLNQLIVLVFDNSIDYDSRAYLLGLIYEVREDFANKTITKNTPSPREIRIKGVLTNIISRVQRL